MSGFEAFIQRKFNNGYNYGQKKERQKNINTLADFLQNNQEEPLTREEAIEKAKIMPNLNQDD